MLSKCLASLVAISLVSVASAGDEMLSSAEGKITLNGQPLPKGKIIFHVGNGQFVGGRINEDGTYKVDRIPAGTHKVTVEAVVNGKNLLPAKYASEERSLLRVELKKGKNTCDISLASR